MILLDDFLVRAALAALGTALAAAVLGCFVVWRRMAYFGDATAHAAILGVALAIGFSLSIFAGVTIVALAMAAAVGVLPAPRGRRVADDRRRRPGPEPRITVPRSSVPASHGAPLPSGRNEPPPVAPPPLADPIPARRENSALCASTHSFKGSLYPRDGRRHCDRLENSLPV